MGSEKLLTYPFVPKSTASLVPGQFWAIPLSNGSFACGRVIGLKPAKQPGHTVEFLGALLEWHAKKLPTAQSIAGVACDFQARVTIQAITDHSAGGLLGQRELKLDKIIPWSFKEYPMTKTSMLHYGLIPVRRQIEADDYLPFYNLGGAACFQTFAEAKYVEKVKFHGNPPELLKRFAAVHKEYAHLQNEPATRKAKK